MKSTSVVVLAIVCLLLLLLCGSGEFLFAGGQAPDKESAAGKRFLGNRSFQVEVQRLGRDIAKMKKQMLP